MDMSYFDAVAIALRTLEQEWSEPLGHLASTVRSAKEHGTTVWICGNGGSYAIAQHWACDLQKVVGVRAQALGANGALFSAWSNDDSYAAALALELETQARRGDVLICLSCSGISPNIRAVQDVAAAHRMWSALVTGGHENGVASLPPIRIPSDDYGVIEDCFSAIGHWLTKELAQ